MDTFGASPSITNFIHLIISGSCHTCHKFHKLYGFMGKHFIVMAGLIGAFEVTSRLMTKKKKNIPVAEGRIYLFRNAMRFIQKRRG
jgi:hypothetical protein